MSLKDLCAHFIEVLKVHDVHELRRALASAVTLIQRRAYGFRSFHNYRLRVIAQCG
jgi:transposase